MKKFFIAAIVAMAMVSCGGPESKAVSFSEDALAAIKSGDKDKLVKLEGERKAYMKSLTKEEKKAFKKAEREWEKEHKDEIKEAVKDFDEDMEDED